MRHYLATALAALFATSANAAPPSIVSDTAISGSLVAEVMGDLGDVQVLLPQGASVHHYQMKPSDARALQSAQLLVWFGLELTPWLDRAATNRGTDARDLELLHLPGTVLRGFGDETDTNRHHDHDEADHDADHNETGDHSDHAEGHDHSSTDPHAWLDPSNAGPWLEAIAGELAAIDPENAQTYAANAQAATQRYAELDAKIAAQLGPLSDRSFVVFHDAYGYFTEHYGLRPAIAVSLGDATSPSAARLRDIRATVTEADATCAFAEQGHDPSLVDTAIEGLGVTMGSALDPSGANDQPGPELYRTVLSGLADSIADCLSDNQSNH